MSTTIVVVGGTGSIGREIVAALAPHAEARVIVAARDPQRAASQLAHLASVRVVELDLARPETFAPALASADKLALVNPLAPGMAAQTRRLLVAARAAGVRHVVRSSLLGAGDPDPIAEAVWHADADDAVRQSGVPFTILQPNQYFQNFINFGNDVSVREHGALFLPLAESRVSNIDTRDIGAAAASALLTPGAEHHGRTYRLTGAEANSMEEVARAIGAALGEPVRYVAVEPATYREGLLKAGVPTEIADAILGWFEYCRAGRAARVEPDVERLLGRKPHTLDDFAHASISRYRQRQPTEKRQ